MTGLHGLGATEGMSIGESSPIGVVSRETDGCQSVGGEVQGPVANAMSDRLQMPLDDVIFGAVFGPTRMVLGGP